jgi:hypothetical protein
MSQGSLFLGSNLERADSHLFEPRDYGHDIITSDRGQCLDVICQGVNW